MQCAMSYPYAMSYAYASHHVSYHIRMPLIMCHVISVCLSSCVMWYAYADTLGAWRQSVCVCRCTCTWSLATVCHSLSQSVTVCLNVGVQENVWYALLICDMKPTATRCNMLQHMSDSWYVGEYLIWPILYALSHMRSQQLVDPKWVLV